MQTKSCPLVPSLQEIQLLLYFRSIQAPLSDLSCPVGKRVCMCKLGYLIIKPHTLIPSNPHMFTTSTLTPSQPHTLTPSHPHTLTPSYHGSLHSHLSWKARQANWTRISLQEERGKGKGGEGGGGGIEEVERGTMIGALFDYTARLVMCLLLIRARHSSLHPLSPHHALSVPSHPVEG